jgi:hypothetical protein
MKTSFLSDGEYEGTWFPDSSSHGTFIGGFVLLFPSDAGFAIRTLRSVLVTKHTKLQVPVTVRIDTSGKARICKIHDDEYLPLMGSTQCIECFCITTLIDVEVGKLTC